MPLILALIVSLSGFAHRTNNLWKCQNWNDRLKIPWWFQEDTSRSWLTTSASEGAERPLKRQCKVYMTRASGNGRSRKPFRIRKIHCLDCFSCCTSSKHQEHHQTDNPFDIRAKFNANEELLSANFLIKNAAEPKLSFCQSFSQSRCTVSHDMHCFLTKHVFASFSSAAFPGLWPVASFQFRCEDILNKNDWLHALAKKTPWSQRGEG